MALTKQTQRDVFYIGILLCVTLYGNVYGSGLGGRDVRSRSDCHVYHSCLNGSYSDTHHDRGCFCDQTCHLYGDCCTDTPGSHVTWEEEKYQHIAAASTCRAPNASRMSYDVYVTMMCPPSYNHNIVRTQCESTSSDETDMLLKVPVTDLNQGIVFKNIFCAVCHGFSIDDVSFWNVEEVCFLAYDVLKNTSIATEQAEQMNRTHLDSLGYECHTEVFIGNNQSKPRPCFGKLIDECAREWNDSVTEGLCQNGIFAVVSASYQTYKNYHCAICNYENEYECNEMRDSVTSRGEVAGQTISILLDLNADRLSLHCPTGHVYDSRQRRCRLLYCEEDYVLTGDVCVKTNMSENIQINNSLSCPRIRLDEAEYLLMDNGSLYVNSTGVIVSAEDYVVENGSVSICSSEYTYLIWGDYSLHSVVQGVLSLAGHILSIVCIIILLLVYSWYRDLHNTPGKILMCVSAALGSAQLCFVVGMHLVGFPTACTTFAVLIHFFYLYAFAWMNVMAYDVWRTFHRQYRVSRSKKTSHVLYYALYATLIPVAIITISLVLDLLNDDSLPSPKYGEGSCWINQTDGLFYFFFLPVLVLILTNWILFLVSVYHISRLKSGTSVLRKGNKKYKKRQVGLYLKLSSVMGLTWIAGFVAAVSDVTALWYVFVILNSVQGVFICAAFLMNRKVKRLVSTTAEHWRESRARDNSSKITVSSELSLKKSTLTEMHNLQT